MSAHDELRQGLAEVNGGHVRVSGSLARDLLAEYDEATSRRTEGGPVTGTRIPVPPGTWVNPPSSTPPLATDALADYEHPERTP